MQKFISRKFLVTIGALIALLEGKNLDTAHLLIIGVVASAYVIAEALIDHAGLPGKQVINQAITAFSTTSGISADAKATIAEAVGLAEEATNGADETAECEGCSAVPAAIAAGDTSRLALTRQPNCKGCIAVQAALNGGPRTLRTFPDSPPMMMPNRTEAP